MAQYEQGFYKEAVREAMVQVEKALKEKCPVETKCFGVTLIKQLFGSDNKGIKLRVPFGDDLQDKAKILFEGVFTYYRNYAAHDGSKIDATTAARILILASELLDLVGASDLSFEDAGGMLGLIKVGQFRDEEHVRELLHILSSATIIDNDPLRLYERLWPLYLVEDHVLAALEYNLVEYKTVTALDEWPGEPAYPIEIGRFELTELGKQIVQKMNNLPS